MAKEIGFAEGPVIRRSGELLFTTLDRGAVYAFDGTGVAQVATAGGGVNGAAESTDGTLYLALAGGLFPGRPYSGHPGGIALLKPSGALSWLTLDPVSPNDLCFGPDGFLYVTDPTRGRRDDGRLWRVDVETGHARLLVSVPWYTNGIAFGHDDDVLYVADSGNARIVRFHIDATGLGQPETVIELGSSTPDGIAFDVDENLIVATHDYGDGSSSVQSWSLAGELLDRVDGSSGTFYTNVALGVDRRLFITDGESLEIAARGVSSVGRLLAVEWPTAGMPLHPFR